MSRGANLPRPSASVILVRDGRAGLETFMVRRHAGSAVAPGAYVFPGGTVRPDDSHNLGADLERLAGRLRERSDLAIESGAVAASLHAGAVRELFEEAGVLLAQDAAAGLVAIDAQDLARQERLASARLALQARQLTLADLLSESGWTAAFDRLVPFSHWVTPSVMAARFDTWFFVAEMPARQAALHCTIETSEGIWIAPREVLSGEYATVYATQEHLRRIAPFPRVADLIEFARSKPIRCVQPRVVQHAAGLRVELPPGLDDAW